MSVEADLVVQHGNLKCSSSPVAVTGRSVLAQPDHEPHIQLQHLQSIMNFINLSCHVCHHPATSS